VEETFGEDPFLVTRLGMAAIRGLQGEEIPIKPEKVLAIAKHYAVHGQPEGGTNSAPGNISERIIREQFLPPFRSAVMDGRVQAVMASYNEIDGIPAHINHWLLTQILREEWGFEGFVTSDGFGVPQLMSIHHSAKDPQQAAKLAIEAGLDCEVPQGLCFPTLVEQVRKGDVSESVIDQSVKRILRSKFLLGLFDDLPYVDPEQAENINNCPEHRSVALEAAQKSVVLLKNSENILPLDVHKLNTIAIIGPNAADCHLGGYAVDPGRGISVLEGIRMRVPVHVNVNYAEGCRITQGEQGWRSWHLDRVELSPPEEDEERIDEAIRVAKESELAILVLGGNEATCREGWWFNHLGDRDDLSLLGRQEELFQKVYETGIPVIVVLINGRPLIIKSMKEKASAILECWYLGQETGLAVADIIFGNVNPSGKLPITFPASVGQIPAYYYQKPSAKRGFLFSSVEPLYPFGYGLSYTTYEYRNIRLKKSCIKVGEETEAVIDLTNTGDRPGDEVVQFYIHDVISTITRPILELRGFKRVHLEPGETKEVSFVLKPELLAGLDEQMKPIVEPGVFEIMIGRNSKDFLTTLLEVVD
jgi:beta-glucosidase